MAIASARSVSKYDQELNGLHGGAKSAFVNLAQNVTLIGKCGTCGGDLVYSLACTKDRIWNYFCVGDGDEKICTSKFIRDARHPFNKDWFLNDANPVTTIMQMQKDINGYTVKEEDLDLAMTVDACLEFDKKEQE